MSRFFSYRKVKMFYARIESKEVYVIGIIGFFRRVKKISEFHTHLFVLSFVFHAISFFLKETKKLIRIYSFRLSSIDINEKIKILMI